MRLIDADVFERNLLDKGFYPVLVRRTLERQPTIEAAPVIHGEWIAGKVLFENDVCSVCGTGIYNTIGINYCPNCGAKMDGKK